MPAVRFQGNARNLILFPLSYVTVSFRLPIILACLLGATSTALAQESPEWTLEAALRQATEAHPDAQMARARAEAARAGLSAAESALWPHIQLQGRYMQTTNPMQGFGSILSQGTFDFEVDFNDPGQIDALSAGVQVAYPLYTGGRRAAQIGSASAHARSSEKDHSAALSSLSDTVVQSYFSIRRADAVMASIEAGITVLEESLRVSRAREKSGDLIKTERLNIEVELARLTRERLAIAHQQRLARSTFAFSLGLEPSTPIILAKDDPGIAQMVEPRETHALDRPEIQSAAARVEAAEHQVTTARSGHRPTINAFAQGDWEKGYRRDGSGNSWTAGLRIDMPVFDGFKTRAQTQQAQAQLRHAEAALRRVKLALALEIEEARLGHELAIAQLKVTRQQVGQATEAAELSRDRFAAGTLLSTELIGVESRLVEAQVQEALAANAERAALAHYRRAVGLPILP